MSFTAMLEGKNSSIEAADQRIYADDERISLPLLKRMEKKLDDMTMLFQQMETKLAEFESKILKLELDINELSTSVKRNVEHDGHKFKERYLNLQFKDKILSPVRTGDEIKGVGGNYLRVALVDETGELVDSGPESSAEVRIFALKGDVNDANEGESEESGFCFDHTAIATARGKKTKKATILVGDVQLKLNKGIGILANIKFRSSSSHVSGMFKIGARIVDSFHGGVVVQDAKTAPFRVRDYRGKYNEKHRPPCLSDEIWRLDNIGRGGSIHNRLKNLNCDTVEDFLIQLLKDSEGLKQLVDLPQKKWEATVKHALTCQLDEKVYCSIHSEENTGIVFNAVGKVLGLIVESQYLPMDTLSPEVKVNASKMDVAAFVHKGGLYSFPDEASVQHKLAELVNPSQLTMSENDMYHEEEVPETVESHQMTNTVAHLEDVAAFVHKGGLYPFPDEASVQQYFPKLAEPLNPSQLTMSENAMYHEEEVSETAESHQMTNTVAHLEDVAAFVHKGGLYPFPDEASVQQYFPKLAEPSNPSQLTMSENAMYHEEEVSETVESHQMTNTVAHFEDGPSSSRPLEIDESFDIDSFFAACDWNQNTSFSDMILESPVVVSDNEVKKKLFFLFTVTKWFLNYERMAAAAACCCDGNGNQKKRRIS